MACHLSTEMHPRQPCSLRCGVCGTCKRRGRGKEGEGRDPGVQNEEGPFLLPFCRGF